MLDFLYEVIYAMLIGTAILNFTISWLMSFFRFGRAYILSAIIGTSASWLIIWIYPASYAGMIIGIVTTIVANLILTNVIYPKLEDKADEYLDKKEDQRIANDSYKALYSSTQEERIEYLCRIMRDRYFYRFQYSADSAHIYQTIRNSVSNSVSSADFANVRVVLSDINNDILFGIDTDEQSVGIVLAQTGINENDACMLGIYAYGDNSNLKGRIAFEKRIGLFLDTLYILTFRAISSIDANCKVSIEKHYSPYAPDGGGTPYIPKYETEVITVNNNAVVQSSSATESDVWDCPECGWINSTGQDVCIGCGKSILTGNENVETAETISPEKKRVENTAGKKQAVKIKRCPKCKGYSTNMKKCSKCGTIY